MKAEKIKWRLLVPAVLTVVFLLFGVLAIFHYFLRVELNGDVRKSVDGIGQLFHYSIEGDAELLSALTASLKEDTQIQKAWREKDREELLRIVKPIFEDLRDRYRVTHLYFHDTEKICFLRVHNPPRFGDFIGRFTMAGAVRKGVPVHGIELGPYGTFALRVVHPWMINGKLAGYIELGEEIDHIISRLNKVLGVEIVMSIHKKNVDRSKWEEGQRMMGRTGKWDQFSNVVISNRTIDINSAEMNDLIKISHKEHAGELVDVESNSRQYRSGVAPITDAAGKHVADILVLEEITVELDQMKKLTRAAILVAFTVFGFLFVFFYFYVGKIETTLLKGRNDLKATIAKLEAALLKVKTLSGMLPICASCKKIRDDKGYWNKIELYIMDHSEAEFTHGMCPECVNKQYSELYEEEC